MHTTKTHVKNPSDTSDEPQNSQRFSGEWETKQLGEISDVNPQNFSSNTNPNYKFNYITLEQVDSGKLLGYSEEVFWTAPSRAQRILQNGDVLMSTVRPNLMAHLFFDGQVPNAVCSTGFAVLRAKHDSSVPYFLFSQLFSEGVNDQIDKILSGSNYPAINSRDVKLIKIPCPPQVSEQRAIAEVLSDIDGLINALEALIAKKQAIKQATMQQLLTGKTRLPGFSGAWEEIRIGDLFDAKAGGDLVQSRYNDVQDNHFPYPIYANGLEHRGLYGFSDYAEESAGSITVTARGTLGQAFYRDTPFVAIGRLLVLKPKISLDARFFCESINYGIHFAVESTGVPQLTAPQVSRYQLPVPTELEQHAIASVLSDMDAEITALEQRRDKTIAIKQGMMQKLLTGRVRLFESRIIADDTD